MRFTGLAACILHCAMCSSRVWATDATLARLSFYLPSQRVAGFEAAYQEKAMPVLAAHGLVESPQRGRATPERVFSRLFEVRTPSAVAEVEQTLREDPAWKTVLRGLGKKFGTAGRDSLIQYRFGFYTAPAHGQVVSAGSGRTVPAGPGRAAPAGPGRGPWRTYDKGSGLAINAHSILQDRERYLWFGTEGEGVVRYDGQSFTRFTTADGLADNAVWSAFQDREGYLWFGTFSGGISRYDGHSFANFTTQDGLAGNTVGAVFQDREGNLWFGTNGGVSRYDGHSFANFTIQDGLADNAVWSIFQDREGHLWFGTEKGGLSRYDGRTWTTLTTQDGLAGNYVVDILQDQGGRLWFGTHGGGVSRYDGKTFTNFTVENGLADNWVLPMLQDKEGYLWVGAHNGLSRYDGRAWMTFTTQDGLTSNGVYAIFQDQEGYLWFATSSRVSRYDGVTFTVFTRKDNLPYDDVRSILQDRNGNLWFGTGAGIVRYDGKTFTTFTTQDGLADNGVSSILQDREGNLWISTNSGLSRYDGKTFTTFTTEDGLAHNAVQSIFQDREGHLWFGTRGGGVARYDGKTFTTFTVQDGLMGNVVQPIFQDREGNFWFGSGGMGSGGVSRYDGQMLTTFTTEDGLANNTVESIFQDQEGNIWFGTLGKGVSRYDGRSFTTFTTEDGLANNVVESIFEDREGHLWFGTEGGISRYDGQAFQTMTREDGLADDVVHSILQDGEGHFWLGTNGGVVRFRPPPPSPPSIFIDAVVADRRYEQVPELALPSTIRLIAFEFRGGMSFKTRPEAMVYRYRLKGYDRDWRTTHSRRVEYQDLPRGNYTFEVQAVDRDLVYSEAPATVRLNIHWPYGQVALVTALGLALGLAGWQTRRVVRRGRALRQTNDALSGANKELFSVNSQLQQKTEDLEKTNEDLEKARGAAEAANHAKSLFLANMSHEIRTPMNAILGYAQILQRSPDLGGQHRRAVETIHKSGDHLLNLINDVLDISKIEAGRMALNPADFDLGEVLENLGTMFELQCREKGLGWRLAGIGSERLAVHGDEAKLRQVLINLLGNAVKFTREGEVALRLDSLPGHRYGFEVRDTGPGMTAQEQEQIFQPFQQGEAGMRQGGTGLGLTISQRQLGLMGSALKVDSEVGKGSRFSFAVELPPAQSALRAEGPRPWGQVQRLAAGFSVKALLADDVAENREILSGMLGELGAQVEAVENGQQALERLEGFAPDIVFLDIRMPVLDGLAAVKLIQENEAWKQVKVVAISASVLAHERQEFLEAGFDDFIDKPFSFERVCECLAQQLGVEFEYGQQVGEETAAAATADWSAVRLPEALASSLKQAAEFYNVTQIEGYLREMESLGEGPKKLASHLRSLRQQHDMEGIVEVLAAVSHE